MTKLRLADTAKADIRNIRVYSRARFGNKTTRAYLDGLQATLIGLRARPLIGVVQRELGDDVRRFSYRSHRVYYRITPDRITVLRILHHAQLEPDRFGDH